MVSRTPVAGAVAFVVVVVVNGAMSALVIEPLLEHHQVGPFRRRSPLPCGEGAAAGSC